VKKTVSLGIAVGAALVAAGGAYVVVSSAQPDTMQVYSLTQPLAANQLVTSTDIQVREVTPDGEIDVYITEEDLNNQLWFAQVGLPAGTPLTTTVVGTETKTQIDLPDNTVIASFEADPASAVAGKVQAGSYINITAVGDDANGDEVARIILNRIYVLDVTTDVSSVSSTGSQNVDDSEQPGPNNPAIYGGIPSLYTVAVTNEQAAKLALARNADLYITITKKDAVGELDVSVTESEVFNSGPVPATTLESVTEEATETSEATETTDEPIIEDEVANSEQTPNNEEVEEDLTPTVPR